METQEVNFENDSVNSETAAIIEISEKKADYELLVSEGFTGTIEDLNSLR
jgi:hypothetical protein